MVFNFAVGTDATSCVIIARICKIINLKKFQSVRRDLLWHLLLIQPWFCGHDESLRHPISQSRFLQTSLILQKSSELQTVRQTPLTHFSSDKQLWSLKKICFSLVENKNVTILRSAHFLANSFITDMSLYTLRVNTTWLYWKSTIL